MMVSLYPTRLKSLSSAPRCVPTSPAKYYKAILDCIHIATSPSSHGKQVPIQNKILKGGSYEVLRITIGVNSRNLEAAYCQSGLEQAM